MTASEERNSLRHAQSFEELETPFLNEELFVDAGAGITEERASRLIGYQLESPFQFAFETESEASHQPEVDESKLKLYNEKEEVDEGEFEEEGDDQEYDEEFYDKEMEQWEKQVAPSSSAPIETKFIDKATSARWLQKVDKAVRNHFTLGGPGLSGRVQFVTQAQFAKQFPGSAILEVLLLLFLTPSLRVIDILTQHGKEVLGGGFGSAEERLHKLIKFIAERIKIGSFLIKEKTLPDPKAGKHGPFVVNKITPRELIAEFIQGVTTSTTAREDRRVLVQLDSEVEVLIHEACHFYTHPKFLTAAKVFKNGNLFFTGLLVSNILIEGFTEYFARQVLETNKAEFGSLGFAAYQSYVEAAGRFIATLEEKTAREAYFKGSEAAIKLLHKAIELNIQNFPLLVPGFMLEGETQTTSIAAELETEEPDELKDEEEESLPNREEGELAAARRSPFRIQEAVEVFAETEDGYADEEASLSELLESPQEQYDVSPIVSKGISDALSNKDWARALELAIREGWRDENNLTNLLFFGRHPELGGRKLDPDKNKEDQKLSQEWERILNREVWSAIVKSAANSALAVSGEDVTTDLRQFRGKDGEEFKARVEWAAKEVDLNPGLLAANLLAETGTRWDYLTKSKVSSYRIGVDDFYDRRGALSRNVPAYSKVGWDRKQKPEVHLNDAQTNPREVKTIRFNSGRDALLASAVYLKYGEVYLRNEAKELSGNFDSLPIDTRFALVRMAFAAGPRGARQYLVHALKGEDILVRVNKPLKIYQTNRNATIRAAQALHLSDWIFGIPLAVGVQLEQEELEDVEDR